jgi:L-alanine-DL-glutamate epimerase-like enolase superfamily enzyme
VKIAAVDVDVLRVPVPRPYLAGGRTVVAHWHVLAQLRTSDGVEGAAGLLTGMPRLERGELVAPDAPGLGLPLDEAAVRRYRVG